MSKVCNLYKGGELSMKRKWTLLFMTMGIMLCIIGCSSVPKEKDIEEDIIKASSSTPNPDKPEKLFLFSTPCVILKKKGVFICYSLINTLIKFMASLPVMTA